MRRRRRRDRSLLAFLLGERRAPAAFVRICCILVEHKEATGCLNKTLKRRILKSMLIVY